MSEDTRSERLKAQLNGVMNCLANSQQEVERLRSSTPKVELVFQNESGCGYSDPFAAVMVDGVQHDKVWAYIDRAQGADGGWYSVVKFRR